VESHSRFKPEASEIQILFVTGNAHKAEEASALLSSHGIHLRHLPFERREIQSDSLEEISKHSATYAYGQLQKPLIVEDAGLFIKSLRGFPGPYSSYVLKTLRCKGILKLMTGVKERSAEFRSAVTYVDSMGVKCFVGVVKGSISFEERGRGGFGFDPIFIPEGGMETFAELSEGRKNEISHRARALRLFAEWFIKHQEKLTILK